MTTVIYQRIFGMHSTIYVKLGLMAVLAAGLLACEKQKDYRFLIERMPTAYRECAAKVVPELKATGRVSQADLLRYVSTLKQYTHSQNRCLRGAVAWSEAQYQSYRQNN